MNIIEHLSEAAEGTPRAPAVSGDRSVSYAELAGLAGGMAGWLSERGVAPGDRVAIWLDKSIEAVACIYAVLQLGAVYVPLDSASTWARAQRAAAHCGARALLTDTRRALSAGRVPSRELPVLLVEDARSDVSAPAARVPRLSTDLAAILYTSGSTGQPKGAAITHGNLAAFVQWAVRAFELRCTDRLLSHAPFHFDLSFFDLFAALRCQGCVVLASSRETATAALIAQRVNASGVTVWQSVPFALTLQLLARAKTQTPMPSVRHVLFAGERMPRSTLLGLPELFPNARYHNVYGCTESNDTFMYTVPEDVERAPDPLPIGKVLPHVRYRIVDDNLEDVGEGEVGCLLVSGSTVMAGYVDPKDGSVTPCGEFYTTHDRVSRGADGTVCFHGRNDSVIKTKGFRVDLTEVEDVLTPLCFLEEVAVLAVPDAEVGNRIVAVVKPRTALAAGTLDLELRAHCALALPKYAIPQRFVVVSEALPKSPTGKLDRRALIERLNLMKTVHPTPGASQHGDS